MKNGQNSWHASTRTTTSREHYFGEDIPSTEALKTYVEHCRDLSTILVDASSLSSATAGAEVIDNYMGRLSQLPPLELDTQDALVRRYHEQGDELAGQLVTLSCLRLVVKIAKEHRRRGIDFMDLIQEGNVGLSEALHRFDVEKGVRFSSYARYWIKARILGYLLENSTIVRLGTTRDGRKLFYNLGKARRALRKPGHEPTSSEIAEFLDVDESSVVAFTQQVDQRPASTDAPINGTELTLGDRLEANQQSAETLLAERRAKSKIEAVLDSFGQSLDDDRKRAIWFERTIADDRKTLRELAAEYDVSKERIRQVENQIKDAFADHVRGVLADDAPSIAEAYVQSA